MFQAIGTFSSMSKFLLSYALHGWHSSDSRAREKALLEYVLTHAEKGNPQSVIKTVDEFVTEKGIWLMNVGAHKSPILEEELVKKQPMSVLELGTFCGYGAICMASNLKKPGSKLVSLELVEDTAEVARKIIDHAALSHKVQVLRAPLSEQVDQLKLVLNEMNQKCFDFVFIDHDKNHYLPDYLVLKENKLIGEGTVLFADNMGFPGAPAFWKYIKSHPQELETVLHKSSVEYIPWMSDTVTVSTFHDLV